MGDTICVRVDANKELGFGHLVRCLKLAETLTAKGWKLVVVSKLKLSSLPFKLPNNYVFRHLMEGERILSSYAQVEQFPWEEADQIEDANLFVEICKEYQTETVIVDNYGISKIWESIIYRFNYKLVVLDDFGIAEHYCSLLINPNVVADIKQSDCRAINHLEKGNIATGPMYHILNIDRNVKPIRRNHREAVLTDKARYLIYFSGVSMLWATKKCLQSLVDSHLGYGSIDIVVRELYELDVELCKDFETIKNVRVHVGPASLVSVYQNADLCIGTAGISLWERLYFGLISVVFSVNQSQIPVCTELSNLKYIEYLGDIENIKGDSFPEELARVLERLINANEETKRSGELVIDNLGLSRVVQAIEDT